jgi:hypothetical protein
VWGIYVRVVHIDLLAGSLRPVAGDGTRQAARGWHRARLGPMAGVARAGMHPGVQVVLRCPVASAGFRAGLTAVGTAAIAAARWRPRGQPHGRLTAVVRCGGVSAPAPTPAATRSCVQPRNYRRQEPLAKGTVRPVSMASCPRASQKCLGLCAGRAADAQVLAPVDPHQGAQGPAGWPAGWSSGSRPSPGRSCRPESLWGSAGGCRAGANGHLSRIPR